MLNDYYEFNIAEQYLPALVNDDFSGLSEDEAKEIDNFIIWGLKQLPDMTIAIIEDEAKKFCEDDVSGLFAECYTVRFYFTNNELRE